MVSKSVKNNRYIQIFVYLNSFTSFANSIKNEMKKNIIKIWWWHLLFTRKA